MKVFQASKAFDMLNGVFCVFKPRSLPMNLMRQMIAKNLSAELNILEQQFDSGPAIMEQPVPQISFGNSQLVHAANADTMLDYSNHPFVVGQAYEPEDIELEPLQEHDYDVSGVCVFGINNGCEKLSLLKKARHLRVYHVSGRLGRATLDFSEKGKIVEKTTYGHVTPYKFDRFLAKLMSHYQKAAFDYAGVDIQSQEAYDLASQGLLRPREDSPALFVSLRRIEFRPPYFTLEIHSHNEIDWYLKNFVHELGQSLRTGACYTKIRKIRDGFFTLDYALLQKHWTLQNIINSIQVSAPIINDERKLLPSQVVGQDLLETTNNIKLIGISPENDEDQPLFPSLISAPTECDQNKLEMKSGVTVIDNDLSIESEPVESLPVTNYDHNKPVWDE